MIRSLSKYKQNRWLYCYRQIFIINYLKNIFWLKSVNVIDQFNHDPTNHPQINVQKVLDLVGFITIILTFGPSDITQMLLFFAMTDAELPTSPLHSSVSDLEDEL